MSKAYIIKVIYFYNSSWISCGHTSVLVIYKSGVSRTYEPFCEPKSAKEFVKTAKEHITSYGVVYEKDDGDEE